MLCFVALLVGCASNDESLLLGANTVEIAGASEETDDAAVAESTTGDGFSVVEDIRSPLTDLFTSGFTAEQLADRIREESVLRGEQTQRCVNQEGFEYQPMPPMEVPLEALGLNASGFDMPEIRRDGTYGVIQNFENPDWVIENVLRPWASSSDPNEDYIENLDENSLAIYFETIAECEDAAYRDINLQEQVSDELADLLENLSYEISGDPEAISILADWTSCMKAAGHSYGSASEIRPSLQQQLDTTLRTTSTFRDGTEQSDFAMMMAEDSTRAINLFRRNFVVDVEAIGQLAEIEKGVAKADMACRGDMEERLRAIEIGYEQDFIDSNEAAVISYIEERSGN